MKNLIKIGDKIGYLMPKTGRYTYVEVVNINQDTLTMLQIQKVGSRKIDNIYNEQISNVISWLKEDSLNFSGRKLLKHKNTSTNYMTEPQERYNNYLKTL